LNRSVKVLRKNLQAQMRSLQIETQAFLKDRQQQRYQNQVQMMQNLATYMTSLQEQVQTYLAELELARQERGQQVSQMLQESRDRRLAETQELFQELGEFRTELRAYCASLHESVWGESKMIQQPEVIIQKPVAQKTAVQKAVAQKPVAQKPVAQKTVAQKATESKPSRATKQPAKKSEPQPAAKAVSQPVVQPEAQTSEPAPSKVPLANFANYTALDIGADIEAASVVPKVQAASDEDQLAQKIYSYIQQIEGARLTEIQSALGINRSQTVDSLRTLIKQGLITQRDRVYLVQEDSL
jgi:hypothetical protein